jgi:hypothetical protein
MINYTCTHSGVHIKSDPISNKLENYRPQHDCTAVCVIAQQYSSVTLVSLRFNSRKKNSEFVLKSRYFIYFLFLKTAVV